MGGQESCRPWDCPCWEEGRLLLLYRKSGCIFIWQKGRGVGWGSVLPRWVSSKDGEQVWCCVLSCPLTLSSAQGKEGGRNILAFALGGGARAVGRPANSRREYMRDPPGMVKERKQGALELTNVNERQLDSTERAEGKTAFPHPCLHAEFVCDSSLLTNCNH